MAVLTAQRIGFDDLLTVSSTTITANVNAVGGPVLTNVGIAKNPVRLIKFTNLCDQPLYILFDGTDYEKNFKDIIPFNGFALYDFGSNKATAAGVAELERNTRFYVRPVGTNPSSGDFYITLVYLKFP